jgi:hypothetical protein
VRRRADSSSTVSHMVAISECKLGGSASREVQNFRCWHRGQYRSEKESFGEPTGQWIHSRRLDDHF